MKPRVGKDTRNLPDWVWKDVLYYTCSLTVIHVEELSASVTNGTGRFFAFLSIIEGTTEKVLQFIMPLKSIYNRNFGFIEQKCIFLNTTESFSKANSIN
jgi:hypothetical protein